MAFTGLATYANGALPETAEDVSGTVTMLSPYEVPFLDLIGDAMEAAQSTVHEFLEDELGPNIITTGSAITSSATGTIDIGITNSLAAFLQVGMVLEAPDACINASTNTTVPEQFQITAIAGNTITVSRAFAGTSSNSVATGQDLVVIADAALEGADVTTDTSKTRTRLSNICQIFKEDIIISRTMQQTRKLGGITSEKDYQISKKLKENMRNLEKAAIRGRISGSTTASSSTTRTMRGLLQYIATNNLTRNTSTGSPSTDFETDISDMIEAAWRFGGTDCDTLMVGAAVKKQLDKLNASRIRTVQDDRKYSNRINIFENTYGTFNIMLNRWMPANRAALIASSRIAIAPLVGSSFFYEEVGKTGDTAAKGMVVGEYTMEVRNERGMGQVRFPQLANATLNTP